MRERYKRQSFLGPDSEKVFADCTACLVGLGGGGSHLAQQLAHLGLGNFRLIDPDSVEESNLNRLVGAKAEDAAKSSRKTIVAERLITNVNPHARVEATSKKWQECHQLLRDCDVIFGCVDAYRDRHELEITARRYLIPYIDIGMDVHSIGNEFSVSGQVILSMPGALCMRCLGFSGMICWLKRQRTTEWQEIGLRWSGRMEFLRLSQWGYLFNFSRRGTPHSLRPSTWSMTATLRLWVSVVGSNTWKAGNVAISPTSMTWGIHFGFPRKSVSLFRAPSPRTESLVAAAVQWAERIMRKIDSNLGGK